MVQKEIQFGTRKVNARGIALQVTIPALFVKNYKIKKGDPVEISAEGDKLIIEMIKNGRHIH